MLWYDYCTYVCVSTLGRLQEISGQRKASYLSCLRSSSFDWMVKKRSKHKKWQVLAQKTKLAPKVHFFWHVYYYENRHINMYNICIRYILVMLVVSTCNNRFMKQELSIILYKVISGKHNTILYIFYLFVCLLLGTI